MRKEFLMGNEAMALGALAAGVRLVCGYPGTPSTEVLETVARLRGDDVYVEWSVNEKAALENAAGAAYAGARTLVTMKQVGLNVASDPLMSLSYIGVKGGMVVLVADDPGPISSQTEQDTRTFAAYSKLPVFDPSSVGEAYSMMADAFDLSEKYHTPVIMRPTTRIDHAYADVMIKEPHEYEAHPAEGFIKDSKKWVIFPRLSLKNHALIEQRNLDMTAELSAYRLNELLPECGKYAGSDKGIIAQGISWAMLMDCFDESGHPRLMKVSTPFPFPEEKAVAFMEGLSEILVIEELDPVIERALSEIAGRRGISIRLLGKRDGTVKRAGENTIGEIHNTVKNFLGEETTQSAPLALSPLPVRPPVLCAGCPHRASFYAVKQAMKGKKTIYCGDIGCYTLGNAQPLDMCDTCLCMGAGINIAQGVTRIEPDTYAFAFVGDSTFFASGITGAVNGYYNGANMTLVILDNSTTAMTGHQPHPGTGLTMMGEISEKVNMEAVLRGIGVSTVKTLNPLDLDASVKAIRETAEEKGLKAIIFRYPCIVKFKPAAPKAQVDRDKCISCKRCIRELGCPALTWKDGKAQVDAAQCTGCTLCEQVCPVHAISGGGSRELKAADFKTSKVGHSGFSRHESADVSPAQGFTGKSIVLSGVGGQGTILASRLIAACAMNAGLSIRTAETIGMAQRGGSVFSCLRVGGNASSPMIAPGTADLILGFEPAEAVRMLPFLKPGGQIVTSIHPIVPVSAMLGDSKYELDQMLDALKNSGARLTLVDTEGALRKLGSDKVMNVLLLGIAAKVGALGFDTELLKGALKRVLSEKLLPLNIAALDADVSEYIL